MQRVDGQLVLSPTDLTKHLACPHCTTLDLLVADGELAAPEAGIDEQLQLIFDKGIEHEVAYLAALRARGLRVIEIDVTRRAGRSREDMEADTVAAMRDGADVIYQATLYDGEWVGYADFLLKRPDRPSRLGGWSYDIADTKLARRLKVPALLQMATYAERLQVLQGVAPERLVVVTGDKAERPWRLLDVAAFARRARSSLRHTLQIRPVTEAIPTAYCAQCRWKPRCEAQWHAADDLSLIAGMRMRHRAALVAEGITTVEQFAALDDDDPRLSSLSGAVRAKLRRQARLQVAERRTGAPAYELLDSPQRGLGLLRLPEPDEHDLYLDFEGDPFTADGQGREYLAGVIGRPGGLPFTTFWAHDSGAEKQLVADLLRFLVEHWERHPRAHVYHYAAYEVSALKRLAGRYGVGEADLDRLLRGERFVDLYAVVKQGVAISKGSYSIKKLEDFYWGHTRTAEGDEVADALSSVVEYERYLCSVAEGEPDQEILDRIAAYNRDDVVSTLDLHGWLEARRDELVERYPEFATSRGPQSLPHESERGDDEAEEAELVAELEAAGLPLWAGLVGWHRRENRPGWWDYYRRASMTDADLMDDTGGLAGLGAPEHVDDLVTAKGRVTSHVWRYPFPPQDCTLTTGKAVIDVDPDPDEGKRRGVGTVRGISTREGWIDISRKAGVAPLEPRAIMPAGPLDSLVLMRSIRQAARAVLAGERPTAWSLVERNVPADLVRAGERATEAVVRVGQALHGEVLAVQGPPGAGKTYAGSTLIRALLDAGCRVGVTAQSHAVIDNLLREVGRPALRKVSDEPVDELDGPVAVSTDNATVRDALASGSVRLVGGTAWLWARPEFEGSVDVLVVDEAGQFSLANAVAVAGAARSIVLLGDPQQLTQPTQAAHPHGAGISVLEHLIEGRDVISADRGIFLDETWRMHPDVTSVVSDISYDGRLASAPGRDRQRVDAPGEVSGAGVRWVPVDHEGNVSTSPEEVSRVVDIVADLLRGAWTDSAGLEQPLAPSEILVVAPYNHHVAKLREALPDGVRVGTVDKFQGQQAAVVIYAMGSSSAHEAPRGVDFLYDVHRLNVAISRAKALAVIVGSPALLDASVHSPEQLRKVNALCELVERAQSSPPPGMLF